MAGAGDGARHFLFAYFLTLPFSLFETRRLPMGKYRSLVRLQLAMRSVVYIRLLISLLKRRGPRHGESSYS